MNTFRGIFAMILLCGAVFAQLPTPVDIQNEFDQTFEKYYTVASKYVEKLTDVMAVRVDQFVEAHSRLSEQIRNISNFNGINLDENNSKIINESVKSIQNLIGDYRVNLDLELISSELNRHLNAIRANVTTAQSLIDKFKNYVVLNSEVGICWNTTINEIGNLVNNGFNQARDAAVFAITNANSTLNLIEFLVLSTVDSNNLLLSSCPSDINLLNGCITTILSNAQITLPANIDFWKSTIISTINTSLVISDSLVNAAVGFVIANIPFITGNVEACFRNILVG